MDPARTLTSPRSVDQVPLEDREFRQIAAMLYQDSGIHLPEGKVSLVHSRLCKRLRVLGLSSFKDYVRLVASDEGAGERLQMLSALTTNHTRFFREDHHFTDLAARLRGGWADHVRRGGRLRIWSSASSSGEEPYSIALTVLSVIPDAAERDVRILATDIDPIILHRAQTGIYSAAQIEPAPPQLREKYFDRIGPDQFGAGETVRRLIRFKALNLMEAWPMKGRFQAIFCRNVAIYFDAPTQDRLWSRFAPLMTPDGRLYIGHSERVSGDAYSPAGQTIYKLKGGA